MSETITLAWFELATAAQVGLRRHIEALMKGLPDKYGFNQETGWNVHIEGAAGEMAVAKCLNMFWNGSVNTFKRDADVGKLQVRTRSKEDYDLLVRPDDRDGDVFVLVTGKAPTFKVHGWRYGVDAKQPEFMQTHGGRDPAYFVPKSKLRNLTSLRELVKSTQSNAGLA